MIRIGKLPDHCLNTNRKINCCRKQFFGQCRKELCVITGQKPKIIRDWNQLPANLILADTIEGFRAARKSSPGRQLTT